MQEMSRVTGQLPFAAGVALHPESQKRSDIGGICGLHLAYIWVVLIELMLGIFGMHASQIDRKSGLHVAFIWVTFGCFGLIYKQFLC
jgi:hypothetical protein